MTATEPCPSRSRTARWRDWVHPLLVAAALALIGSPALALPVAPALAAPVAATLSAAGSAVVSRDAAALPAQLATILQAQALTGIVWTLVDPALGVRTGAAGLADARSAVPMTVQHRVHVGSVAKTALALGVLRLVQQGRLALDQPVAPLLHPLVLHNPWEAQAPVRLRHLLDHTSGLDDARLSQAFSLRVHAEAPLAEAFARQGHRLPVRVRPGETSSYSNSGYTLLGMVIEAVTRQPYERFLDTQLLQPLGLHDSSFRFSTQAGPQADARLAMGHFERGAAQAAVPIALRPAGQFSTTAADMGRLAQFLMGDGHLAGQPFVAAPLLRAMGQPTGTAAAAAGLAVGYALGLATRDRHGVPGRCHGGSSVGYRAMFCLYPSQQKAYFYAVNTDSDSADHAQIDWQLTTALSLAAPAPQTQVVAPPPGDAAAHEGWYLPSPSRFESLAWLDMLFGVQRLQRTATGWQLSRWPTGTTLALEPLGGALLRAPGRSIASHVLLSLPDGRRLISTGAQTHQRASPWRVLAPWASLSAAALGGVWLLLRGLQAAARRQWPAPALATALAGLLALLLPLPLFFGQSFLALGDLTPASALLAATSGVLPLTLLIGLGLKMRHRQRLRPAGGSAGWLDALAMAAVLQLCVVLAAWGLLPLRLWA